MELPWCAAKRCPLQNDCQSYITRNDGNQDVLPLTACCKVLCGASWHEVGMLALQCGGVSSATAYAIVFYTLFLFVVGAFMVLLGSILSLKRLSFWITAFGTLIFMTVTGVYVTYLTSPFKIVDAVPAVGAMNIAIFSYFFSGFQYSIGVAYEGGPLIALLTTAYAIWRAILTSGRDGSFLRDANRMALTMLVMAFIWVLHSVSYRILGYRVEWRITEATTRRKRGDPVNMCYLLGAAQGHPTWRTPVGQCTSIELMVLAWALQVAVRNDLKNYHQCRADWVLTTMLWLPPVLITIAVGYILLSALRNRTIIGIDNMRDPQGFWEKFLRWLRSVVHGSKESERRGEYPGLNMYKNFFDDLGKRRQAYVQAVALHRRGRNTYFIENVTRLGWPDYLIGVSAWLLATIGVVMVLPVMLVMYVLASVLGRFLETLPCGAFKCIVSTTVTREEHLKGAAKVVREAYVGTSFDAPSWEVPETGRERDRFFTMLTENTHQRYINLPYLLDNISHEELHVLFNE